MVRRVRLGRDALEPFKAEVDVNRVGVAVEALEVRELRPDAPSARMRAKLSPRRAQATSVSQGRSRPKPGGRLPACRPLLS
jgi:hypothetical protein